MKQEKTISVNLSNNHLIYKQVEGELVQLEEQEPGKRYGSVVPFDGEPYLLQHSDEEEAQANQQKADWDAGTEAREAEEKQRQEDQEKFENTLQYQTRIVAFLDILGWGNEVDNGQGHEQVVKEQGKTLALLKSVADFHNSLNKLLPDGQKWPSNPIMTQFSDSLVLSFEDDSNKIGKESLCNALSQLTTILASKGFLLRGGVFKGKIYHTKELIFGPALNQAYKLESEKAVVPRVILEPSLAIEWNVQEQTAHETVLGERPWVLGPDGYFFFNFLPPFKGNSFFTDTNLWKNQLTPFRNMIIEKAQDRNCSEVIFAKYEWLAGYFDSICYQYPIVRDMEVSREMKLLRWQITAQSST